MLSWIHQLEWGVMGWKSAADAPCQTLGLATAGRAARRSGKTWQWGQPVPSLATLPNSHGSVPVVSSSHLHSPRTCSWTGVRHCQLLLQLENFIPPFSDLSLRLFSSLFKNFFFSPYKYSFMLIERGGLAVPGRRGNCINFPAQSHNQLRGWFR